MFKLKQNQNLHFIVIGTGGTGGYLIENLLRLVDVQTPDQELQLTIIDGDSVEKKNLIRQNFYEEDIDKNKAQALYERYIHKFLNVNDNNFKIAQVYLDNPNDLRGLFRMQPNSTPVVVGAVDNNATRQLIHTAIKDYEDTVIWVDAGNSERVGQVILGTRNITTIADNSILKLGLETSDFQSPVDLYPEDFKVVDTADKLPNDVSCAEHAISSPQNIAANIFSATTLFGVLNKLIGGELIDKQQINFDTSLLTIK